MESVCGQPAAYGILLQTFCSTKEMSYSFSLTMYNSGVLYTRW